MSLIYSPSVAGLFMHAVIFANGGPPTNLTVLFMSGTMPTPTQLITDWETTYKYPTNCLAAFNANFAATVPGSLISVTNPQTVTAFGTGVVEWAIIWDNTGWTSSDSYSNGIPSQSFMIVPASDAVGSGVFRLSTASLVAATTFNVIDGSFTAQVV